MSRTNRRHAPLPKLKSQYEREQERVQRGLKSHKQRRVNDRIKLRKGA